MQRPDEAYRRKATRVQIPQAGPTRAMRRGRLVVLGILVDTPPRGRAGRITRRSQVTFTSSASTVKGVMKTYPKIRSQAKEI